MYEALLAVGLLVLVYALLVSERVHRTTAVLLAVGVANLLLGLRFG